MISANLIIKNEIDTIENCINSIRPHVQEIICIDTGSTDGTLEYLKKQPDITVYEYEWSNDFADMRNKALEKSNGEWILIVDGDMELIQFQKPDFSKDYYICNIQILSSTKNLFQFPLVMLFKKEGVKFLGARHATIEESVKGKQGDFASITFSHPELSKGEIKEKMQNNLKVHLRQLVTEPDNETVNYHLCRTYFYLNEYQNSIDYGLKVLQSKLNNEVKAITSILIFLCYSLSNNEMYGIQFLSYSLKLIPKQILGRFLMFQLFINAKNYKLANETYEEIEHFSLNRISDLPADYYLNKKQLNILKGDLKNG